MIYVFLSYQLQCLLVLICLRRKKNYNMITGINCRFFVYAEKKSNIALRLIPTHPSHSILPHPCTAQRQQQQQTIPFQTLFLLQHYLTTQFQVDGSKLNLVNIEKKWKEKSALQLLKLKVKHLQRISLNETQPLYVEK